jgi:tRNA-guanine transglycosylase
VFEVTKFSSKSKARLGRLETGHGLVKTPTYIFVGTEGKIRTLSPTELNNTDIEIIISNTYHLWREMGFDDNNLKKFEGLHQYMNWQRPIMTDSGGFQVFSLGYAREFGGNKVKNSNKVVQKTKRNLVKITEEGVYFKIKGKQIFLDAGKSIQIQESLGADIILAFDEPSSPYHSKRYTELAMERTHRWAEKSLEAHSSNQTLFGIVQGGEYQDLRVKSAKLINSLGFDGYSLGGAFGNSFGSKSEDTFAEIDWMIEHLDDNKPRHLLGIGRVRDLFIGVKKGIDMFDCVIPTREGRHGKVYTKEGEINIKNAQFKNDKDLLGNNCNCLACRNKITRGDLRKLFKDKNRLAGKYATAHNIAFFTNLMREIRRAIKIEELKTLEDKYLKYY